MTNVRVGRHMLTPKGFVQEAISEVVRTTKREHARRVDPAALVSAVKNDLIVTSMWDRAVAFMYDVEGDLENVPVPPDQLRDAYALVVDADNADTIADEWNAIVTDHERAMSKALITALMVNQPAV